MTWHSFFDLSTMEHRHLLFAYAAVLAFKAGMSAGLPGTGSERKMHSLQKNQRSHSNCGFVVRE